MAVNYKDILPAIDQSKLDDMHYDGSKLLSYNKKKNIIISARELGKTTWFWLYVYRNLRNKAETAIVFRYLNVEITDIFIDDTETVLNKFLKEPIKFSYKSSSIKDGMVDVNININGEEIKFFRVISLSLPKRRIKSLILPEVSIMMLDEAIVDTRNGEKYPAGLVMKMNEIYKTFVRDSKHMRFIFMANPYSLFCWIFEFCHIDTTKVYPVCFEVSEDAVCECGVLSDKLKAYILERDKDFIFDNSYNEYAFDGRSINDTQIQILSKCPEGYSLKYLFYIEGKKLGVFRNNDMSLDRQFYYWIGTLDSYNSNKKDLITFDYNSLINGTKLFDKADKNKFYFLKWCFRNRRIAFKTINESYLFEQIFENLK